jgi:hypothetical protein
MLHCHVLGNITEERKLDLFAAKCDRQERHWPERFPLHYTAIRRFSVLPYTSSPQVVYDFALLFIPISSLSKARSQVHQKTEKRKRDGKHSLTDSPFPTIKLNIIGHIVA